ncbi:MAG: TonB-dependent receptor, partial [Acidobacteriota bacterium]
MTKVLSGWGRLSLALALLLFLTLPILAQERFGSLTGVATDPSAARLPEVAVTITNKATNRTVTVRTRGDGTYNAPDLEPGRYSVRFEKSGFSRYEVPDVLVLLGRTIKVDAAMQVGALEQVVQVTEAAPLIDTTSTMIAQNVAAEEFDRLPKPRSFQGIAIFSTSVNTGEIEGGYQVNGASAAENNYYIDGVSTTSLIDGRARQNAVFEFLQEVQVKTAGLAAEYGGALGGVVSGVTKSGGNDFHGEIHYYFFGNALSASPTKRLQLDPVEEQTAQYFQDEKQSRNYHEFGGSLGGPIVKNKLWFFTSFSPRWQRSNYNYVFSNGTEPGTLERKAHQMNWFNKLSFDPSSRVRTNFTWLYTPQYLTGSLPAYDGWGPNYSTLSLANAQGYKTRGYNQPEQSYTGNIDMMLSNTSLLSVKGGRYYLNYKEVGIPYTKYYWWQSSSVGIEGVPLDLQQPVGFRTPSGAQVLYDKTTRTYVQADFSQFLSFGGQHNIKAGIGTQKNVNSVFDAWVGGDGRMQVFWDLEFREAGRGKYGYYSVDDAATRGSTGANITHLYIQDSWRIHPRLSLSLGLRSEKETIPAFNRA